MGIRKMFFSRNKKKDKNSVDTIIQDTSPVNINEEIQKTDLIEEKVTNNEVATKALSADLVTDTCEQIGENNKQLDELKAEYQAVTEYLTDIQKIERIPEEDREFLNDTARKILAFNKDRVKYKNSTKKISDIQFKHLAKFDDVLSKELKRMKTNEAYHNTIKNDMKYLEGEKGALLYEKEEILSKHSYLKGIAIATCILVAILFLVFVAVNQVYGANMEIPFILTIFMILGSATYIYINSNNNRKDMILTERKLSRAVSLMNKVKIKYVNNTNELEYSYQKYMVNSYAELSYLWEQYKKAKEEEALFRNSTEQINLLNRDLVRELRSYGLADPGIWVYQAEAIVDNKEMVEVRHRLNSRRQKLRESIDYNNKLRDQSLAAIKEYMDKNPDKRKEVNEKLKSFGIYNT
jgi:hypothetical protein